MDFCLQPPLLSKSHTRVVHLLQTDETILNFVIRQSSFLAHFTLLGLTSSTWDASSCVGGVCNFLSSVLPQQKFEGMDGPAL